MIYSISSCRSQEDHLGNVLSEIDMRIYFTVTSDGTCSFHHVDIDPVAGVRRRADIETLTDWAEMWVDDHQTECLNWVRSMGNWTPGHWTVGETSDEPDRPEIVIRAAGGSAPAVALPYPDQKKTEANARLIAVAPEMAEQLRWMSEQIRLLGVMALPETQRRGADIAALLAKIEGDAP